MIPLQVMEREIRNTDWRRALQLSYLNIPFTTLEYAFGIRRLASYQSRKG
jgi:hypothetical protein